MSLAHFGWTDALGRSYAGRLTGGLEPARVTSVNRNDLEIETEVGSARAEPAGRLRFEAAGSLDLPVVGDWVAVRMVDDGFGIVSDILPRRSTLARREPGGRTEVQLMAANVDTAFIVQPADQPVHVRRMERYLVVAREGGVEPVIVLSKADTVSPADLEGALAQAREIAESLPASGLVTGGMGRLRDRLIEGATHVLLGPSGVGKSTIVNALFGEERQATRAVRSADRKGRHTTTRRELMRLPGGALIIDTPGMRELGLVGADAGLDETFNDLEALAEACRFRDCTHTGEAGCAVLDAVSTGAVSATRYEHWMRLHREAAHYERSHVELRRRDKAFGKMVRQVMKEKKDRR